jgi:hypothetical protein
MRVRSERARKSDQRRWGAGAIALRRKGGKRFGRVQRQREAVLCTCCNANCGIKARRYSRDVVEHAAEAAFRHARSGIVAVRLAIAVQGDGDQAAAGTEGCGIRAVGIAGLSRDRQCWDDGLCDQSPQHKRQHAPGCGGVGAEAVE